MSATAITPTPTMNTRSLNSFLGGSAYEQAEAESRKRFGVNDVSNLETRVSSEGLNVYYCTACATYAFILLKPITALPTRSTDGSHVVKEKKHLQSLKLKQGVAKRIKRAKGIERQYRFNCSECDLVVAYRPVDFDQPNKYMYVLPGAVTETPDVARGLIAKPPVPKCFQAVGPDTAIVVEPLCDQATTCIREMSSKRVLIALAMPYSEQRVNDAMLKLIGTGLDVATQVLSMDYVGPSLAIRVAGMTPRQVYDSLLANSPGAAAAVATKPAATTAADTTSAGAVAPTAAAGGGAGGGAGASTGSDKARAADAAGDTTTTDTAKADSKSSSS